MKHTDRDATADCPKCEGKGGEAVVYGGMYGSGEDAEWARCEACEGEGWVQRVDRLAWLIGEERRMDAQLALHAAMLAAQKNPPAWKLATVARVAVPA